MLCRVRRHQNAFRHNFWWLYIRICPSNYQKKIQVTGPNWWPNIVEFGFSTLYSGFRERERNFWKLLSESVKITISTLQTTPVANFLFMFHLGNWLKYHQNFSRKLFSVDVFLSVFWSFWAINEHLGPSGWFCRSDFVFSAFWHFGAKWSVHIWLKMLKSPKSTCPTSDHREKNYGDICVSFLDETRKNTFWSHLMWSVWSI